MAEHSGSGVSELFWVQTRVCYPPCQQLGEHLIPYVTKKPHSAYTSRVDSLVCNGFLTDRPLIFFFFFFSDRPLKVIFVRLNFEPNSSRDSVQSRAGFSSGGCNGGQFLQGQQEGIHFYGIRTHFAF